MILFSKDWQRYPNAIVDMETSNASFLRMARLFKAMGVSNHAWPLALHNPLLQGIDPHSPHLTLAQKAMIKVECSENPWYVFREIMQLPATGGPIRYIANRGNLALMFCFYAHVDAANIQPRQTGKSGSTDCLSIDVIDLRGNETTMYLITKDAQLRQANIERLKGIRSLLPSYLLTLSREDSDNQHELTNKFRGNYYRTGVARSSESSANNLGRGMTGSCFHIDEGPFISWIGVTLEAALAAGTTARIHAAQNNQPYGNIFTTTAGKKDSRDGRYMYDLIHSGATWNERYYDATDREEFETLIGNAGSSDKALANITLNHRQLGYPDKWLYDAMANALRNPNATKEGVERDFLNIWSSGSLSSPLSVELNEQISNSVIDPLYTELTKERYTINWYVRESEIEDTLFSSMFVLGGDLSEAINRDAIAHVLIDIRSLKTIATITINETNLLTYSHFLADFLIRYRNIVFIPEKKSIAQTVVDTLILRFHAQGIDPFRRIFNRVVDEHDEHPETYKEICKPLNSRRMSFYDALRSKFGFNTTAGSRDLLYGNVLQEAAKKVGRFVLDAKLSSEIRELVIKNDRIDHKQSGHDDHVIAWLLAHWFLMFGRNLRHYGIEPSEVMSEAKSYTHIEDLAEERRKEEQKRLLGEIESLIERLKSTKDPLTQLKIENRLRNLALNVDESKLGGESSVDQLIEAAKNNTQVKRKITPNEGFKPIRLGGFYSGL